MMRNARNRSTRRRRSERGIVLLLVVVVLVLMVIIGAAYLQVVRVERLATRGIRDNIDTVAASILAEVGTDLRDDLVGPNGAFFSAYETDEPYDYPWTNGNWPSDKVNPGQNDDMWLASTLPVGGNTWAHISNVNKRKLFVTNVGQDPQLMPTELATLSDTNIAAQAISTPIPQAALADADGDGITDSRWKYAPIQQIQGITYFYGVRVIDLSALMNLNVGLTADNGLTDARRYHTPADLDLAAVLTRLGSSTPTTWMQYRLGLISPPSNYRARLLFWLDGPRSNYPSGTPTGVINAFSPQNEAELRFRNGLNSDVNPDIELPAHGLLLLRGSQAAESTYANSPFNTPDTFLLNEPRHQLTTINGTSDLATAQWGTSAKTLFRLPDVISNDGARNQLGRLLLDPEMPFGVGATAVPFGNSFEAAAQLVACVADYFDLDSLPPKFDPVVPQPLAAGQTYADPDSRITKVALDFNGDNIVDATRYGMEGLPFLTEAYVQAAYWLSQATKGAAAPDPNDGDMYDLTWQKQGDMGFAIEMVNPFSSAVRNLDHVRLRIRGDGSAWQYFNGDTTKTLFDIFDRDFSRQQLKPGAGLIVYQDSGGDAKDVKHWSAVPADWSEKKISGLTLPFDKDIIVELQVLVAPKTPASATDADWITYSRLQRKDGDVASDKKETTLRMPVSVQRMDRGPYKSAPGTGNSDYERIIQRTTFCDPSGLNPTAVLPDEYEGEGVPAVPMTEMQPQFNDPKKDGNNDPAPPDKEMPLDSVDKITDAAKGSAAAVPPWTTHTSSSTLSYGFNDVGIQYATDIFRVMWVGPTPTKTYAEVLREAAPTQVSYNGGIDEIRSRQLNPSSDMPTPVTGSPPPPNVNRQIPRSQLLMDRLTAIAVAGGTPIFGRLNVNTVREEILLVALGQANLPVMGTIGSQIIALRDNMGGMTRAGQRGFASLGELMQLSSVRQWPGATDGQFNDTYGGAPIAFTDMGETVMTPQGPDGAGGTADDPPIDDHAEELRLAGFLMNVLSVRSDFYCAYVVVNGYRPPTGPTDTKGWKEPVETARFLAVFDRTNVKSRTDTPRVVAFFRIN